MINLKWILVLYAALSIAVQIVVGQLTGYGQGSIGVMIFLFLVEVDPRLKFSYVMPNLRQKQEEPNEEGELQ